MPDELSLMIDAAGEATPNPMLTKSFNQVDRGKPAGCILQCILLLYNMPTWNPFSDIVEPLAPPKALLNT